MRKMVFLFGILGSVGARAFEVDGFTSGATKRDTLARASGYGHKFERLADVSAAGTQTYFDQGTSIALTFCDGRLVRYRRVIGNALIAFARVVEKESLKFGPANEYEVKTFDSLSGATSTVRFSWNASGFEKEITIRQPEEGPAEVAEQYVTEGSCAHD